MAQGTVIHLCRDGMVAELLLWWQDLVTGPGIGKQRASRGSRTTYNFPARFTSVQLPSYWFQLLKILKCAKTLPPAVDQVSKQMSLWGTFYFQTQVDAIKCHLPTDF